MIVYDYLCQIEGSKQLEEYFKLHIFCDGLKTSFRRYRYFLELLQKYPEESSFNLLLDTSIYFNVSEQTIYKDIAKMEFVLFTQYHSDD